MAKTDVTETYQTCGQEKPLHRQPVLEDGTISDCSSDGSYNVENELSASPDLRLEHFVKDQVLSFSRDNVVSLALFLCYQLENLFRFTATNAAEYDSVMLGKSDRTIRQWKTDFLETGDIADSQQGRYQRSVILCSL